MRLFSILIVFIFSVAHCDLAHTQTVAAATAGGSTAPEFAEKIVLPGIPNAGKINTTLYRGAQPNIRELSALKSMGITTIVDLRAEANSTSEEERTIAQSLGMRFVHIPIGGFSTPTTMQLAKFLALFRETPPQSIFVHCEFGRDRTGLFIASYRIAYEHWTSDRAISEMLTFGFRQTWHPSMASFVRALPERLASDPILKSALPEQGTGVPEAGAGTK